MPDTATSVKAAALLVAEGAALEPVPLAVVEAPEVDRDGEALVVFPPLSDAAPVPETSPAVTVTLINWRSLPVNVTLVDVEVLAGFVTQSVSVAVAKFWVSYTPCVASQAASVIPVILQSILPKV